MFVLVKKSFRNWITCVDYIDLKCMIEKKNFHVVGEIKNLGSKGGEGESNPVS